MTSKVVELLQLLVFERHDSSEEAVPTVKGAQHLPELGFFFLRVDGLNKMLDFLRKERHQLGMTFGVVKENSAEGLGVRFGVHVLIEDVSLELVDGGGVRWTFEQGSLVVILEGRLNGFGIVGEIENKGLLFPWRDTVETGQGLNGIHATQSFVDVHGVEQGLVEAGLIFVGDDQDTVFILVKLACCFPVAKAVHVGFRVILAVDGNRICEATRALKGFGFSFNQASTANRYLTAFILGRVTIMAWHR